MFGRLSFFIFKTGHIDYITYQNYFSLGFPNSIQSDLDKGKFSSSNYSQRSKNGAFNIIVFSNLGLSYMAQANIVAPALYDYAHKRAE